MYVTRALRLILHPIVLVCLLWCGSALSAEPLHTGSEGLLLKYHEIEADLLKNHFCIPIHVESFEEDNSLQGGAYGIIEYPFNDLRSMLQVPATWCDIALLHFNIKACTYRKLKNKWLLTFYSGRKFYQPPQDTYQLKYDYRIIEQQPEYLKISLTADHGPLKTKDYRIDLEAMPLEEESTFVHFSYAYSYGSLARMAMKGYFATLGRGKFGFSVVNTDSQGSPIYVSGTRGVIERNAVRYYFAIQAYMDTLKFPKEKRFEKRVSQWYDLTDQHQKQLFEMSKEEYLKYKKQERANQLMLQRQLGQYHSGEVVQ